MNTCDTLLERLAGIADAVGGDPGREIIGLVAELRATAKEIQARTDTIAAAQAEAIVNAGMMMSELQETHDELDRARREAEKSDRAKSEFLAHMSHEIRTPFNGVLGMNEILLKSDLDDHQRHCALTIHQSAESLLTIINDILDFSKIEAGKLSLQPYAFDLRDLMEAVTGLFAHRVQAKGVELLCHMPHDLPRHWIGDAGRLRQVLTNLIGNAVKFTHAGEVSVVVSVPICEAGDHESVRFDVTDTGVGIPESARGRIFEAFVQAEDSTERQYGGTGLGLAISAKLVGMMDGEIHVDDGPAGGTRFWFTVRISRDPAADAAGATTARRPRCVAGQRILVVDDNVTNLEICVEQLKGLAVRTEVVSSGADALTLMRNGLVTGDPFDMVILDMDMPSLSGLDVSRAIEADATLRGTRRILLSSIGDIECIDTLRAAGIARAVTKPVRQSELQACVTDVLGDSPRTPRPAFETPGTSAPAVDAVGTVRILVAEDNAVNQLVARAMLKSLGLRCDIAEDGSAALDAWRTGAYDLILMDCHMPVVDGFEATHRIRAAEAAGARPRTPIVALTANAIVGDREACLDAGMDDYLSKPYTALGLAEKLSRWLDALPAQAERVGATAGESRNARTE
jgi:signal transduction histidine kinase/DNA-binding response OmpR family regulator